LLGDVEVERGPAKPAAEINARWIKEHFGSNAERFPQGLPSVQATMKKGFSSLSEFSVPLLFNTHLPRAQERAAVIAPETGAHSYPGNRRAG